MLDRGKKPAYHYVFDCPQPGDDAGTPHSCDNRYQFGTLDGCWRPYGEKDWELSAAMRKYWANFARTGDPNGEGLPRWEPYDARGLSLCLCREGCAMKDYDRESGGRIGALRQEILDAFR